MERSFDVRLLCALIGLFAAVSSPAQDDWVEMPVVPKSELGQWLEGDWVVCSGYQFLWRFSAASELRIYSIDNGDCDTPGDLHALFSGTYDITDVRGRRLPPGMEAYSEKEPATIFITILNSDPKSDWIARASYELDIDFYLPVEESSFGLEMLKGMAYSEAYGMSDITGNWGGISISTTRVSR